MSNWKKIIVSGSGAHLSSITASNGSIISGSLTMSGSIGNPDYIDFRQAETAGIVAGRMEWNTGDGTLDLGLTGGNVTLQVGQQTYARIYNAEATTLNKGEVVYISGSQGNRIAAKRASSVAEAGSANTLGFVAESITAGSEGFIITNGVLKGLNTTGLTGGHLLYLSSSAGQYTTTPTVAPDHTVILGYVERVHASAGSIYVKIDNGYELGELHNVLTNGATYGDLLMYSGSLWTHKKQLSGSYGLTGSLQATSLTGSLQGTASNAISSSYALTASYSMNGGAGGVTISGPTMDITDYPGSTTHYMLVYDGNSNDITGSHLLTINPGNESIDVQIGIEMFNNSSISTGGSVSANSGFYIGANSWTGTNISATASYAATASRVSTLNQNVTVSGSVFLSGSLHTPVFVDYEEKYTTINHNSAGGITYDLSLGNIFYVNQNANITISTITNPPTATNLGSFTVILDSDAAYTVAWPASVEWTEVPNLDNGPAINILSFITPNGGTDWYGFIGGLGYNNV